MTLYFAHFVFLMVVVLIVVCLAYYLGYYYGSETLTLPKDKIRELLPDTKKLELLADYFDNKYPNDNNKEVQNELREWAKNISSFKKKNGL